MHHRNRLLERFALGGTLFAVALYGSPAVAREAHEHDGFYLRLGAGLGFGGDDVSGDQVLIGKTEATLTGVAGVSEVAIGGSLAHGVVLGGGIYSSFVPSPKATDVKQAGINYPEDLDFDASSFHVIAPFMDWYLQPEKGLHLQAALGLGVQKIGDGKGHSSGDRYAFSQTDTGFAFMVGFGNEWWVGDNWGLGILGRLTMGFLGGDDDNKVHWSHTVYSPAILFTATMN